MRCSLGLSVAALAALQVPAALAINACQAVASAQSQALSKIELPKSGDLGFYVRFDAEKALECINAVPLDVNSSIATIDLLKRYYAFDTTLAYLKDPPASYQSLPVDVMGRLDQVSQTLQAGGYNSTYEMEVDIKRIFITAREGHMKYNGGLLGIFNWVLPDSLISVSSDGKALPQVYASTDILLNKNDTSPIVEINNQTVFAYLRNYIETMAPTGLIESHADWNAIMFSSATLFGNIGSTSTQSTSPSLFQSTSFYNGPSLNIRFANGTSTEWVYKATSSWNLLQQNFTSPNAIFNSRISSVQLPITDDDEDDTATATLEKRAVTSTQSSGMSSTTAAQFVPVIGYPKDPVVKQENFTNGGFISGYLLKDASVGVLSLPSFATTSSSSGSADSQSFSDAVEEFISQAKNAGMKKIVIDLSGNTGGTFLLGFNTFRQFFPDTIPTVAFRARSTPNLKTIGSIVTEVLSNPSSIPSNVYSLFTGPGSAASMNTLRTLNLNGENWASYADFSDPHTVHGDNFTQSGRYNLSDPSWANGVALGPYLAGYGTNKLSYDQPWKAEDITLLLDGWCASTCSLFAELMKTDGGVKSVAVGGIPQYSPMQGVCGTRGSNILPHTLFSAAVEAINTLLSTVENTVKGGAAVFLESIGLTMDDVRALPAPLSKSPVKVFDNSVNALDEVRASSPDDPLAFTYEAANCRIFWTGDMVRDLSQLWRAVAKYSSGDTSVCVEGSVDGPGSKVNETILSNPGYSYNGTWSNANSTKVPETNSSSRNGNNGGDNDDNSGAASYHVSMTALVGVLLATAFWM